MWRKVEQSKVKQEYCKTVAGDFGLSQTDIGAGTYAWEAIQTFFPADNTRDSNESAPRVIELIVALPGVPEIDPASLLPTNDQTSIISGTGAEDGATITLFADLDGDNAAERNLGTFDVPVGTDGSWNIDLDNVPAFDSVPAFGGLPEGEVTLVAIQTNPAGASVGSGTGIGTTENPADRIEVDLTSPATPTIDELQNTPIRTPVITGTGEPGAAAVVRATVPGQPAGTAILDGIVASIAVDERWLWLHNGYRCDNRWWRYRCNSNGNNYCWRNYRDHNHGSR